MYLDTATLVLLIGLVYWLALSGGLRWILKLLSSWSPPVPIGEEAIVEGKESHPETSGVLGKAQSNTGREAEAPGRYFFLHIVLYLAMILGMVSVGILKSWKNSEESNFWLAVNIPALLVSPIVFRYILGKSGWTSRSLFENSLVAFENGFFWETIFGTLEKGSS